VRWRSLEGGLGREKWVREREAARLRANSNREVLHVVSTCAMAAPSWVGRRGMEESGRGEPHQSQTSINRSPVTRSHMQKSADRYRHWPIQWITGVCSLTLSSSVRWDPALLYVPIAVTEIFSPKKLPQLCTTMSSVLCRCLLHEVARHGHRAHPLCLVVPYRGEARTSGRNLTKTQKS